MIVFLFVIEGFHLQKQRNEMNKLINIKSSPWGEGRVSELIYGR